MQLPEALPPARLREAVLTAWHEQHEQGRGSGRAAPWFAAASVATLFALAIALPWQIQPSPAIDSTVAMLRALGVEVSAAPTVAEPAKVRRVATGSAAARVGLRAGDRLLTINTGAAAGAMTNMVVLRGESPRYFALPRVVSVGPTSGAGMVQAPARPVRKPRLLAAHATATSVATS